MPKAANTYSKKQPHGLMFHRFHRSDTKPLGQGSVTETNFEKILEHVGIDRIQTPDEWSSKVDNDRLENQDLCITFDDGLQSQFEIALPILDRHNIKAFWFIFSSVFEGDINKNEIYNCFATSEYENFDCFVDDFLPNISLPETVFSSDEYGAYFSNMKSNHSFYTEKDIKFRYVRNYCLSKEEFELEMSEIILQKGKSILDIAEKIWMKDRELRRLHTEGHTIGLHSYSHPFAMADLPGDEQEYEYRENHRHVSSITKCPVTSMAHPLNSYGLETLNILSVLNVSCGFRSDMKHKSQLVVDCLPHLQLPREDSTNLVRAIQ